MSGKPDTEQKSLFKEPKAARPKKDPMLYIVKANTRVARCRGENCRKPVFFVYLLNTGRTVIVDCEPVYAPNHKTKANQDHEMKPRCFPPVHPNAPGEHYPNGMDGQGIDHHFTCADVRQFGRKTERKND